MKNQKFIIFADCPSPIDRESLLLYKAAGFDTYVLTEDYIRFEDSTENYKKLLRRLQRAGLKVFVRGIDTSDSFPHYFDKFKDFDFNNFPAVTGFYMTDEPCAARFKQIAGSYVKMFNEKYPSKHFHINLFPSYAGDSLGTRESDGRSAYENYIDSYVKIVLNSVEGDKNIGLDHYPFLFKQNKNLMRTGWLYDLHTVAKAAAAAKVGYSVCIQCFDDGDAWRTLTTQGEFSLQIFTSLAFGTNMFEFFIYNSLNFWEGAFTGMVKEGKKTAYYDFAKNSIQTLRSIEQEYFKLSWQAVNVTRGEIADADNNALFDGLKGKTALIEDFSVKASRDVLTGIFTASQSNGKGYVLVNFSDPVKGQGNEIELKFADKTLQTVKLFYGNSWNCLAPENGRLKIKLPAGEGALLILNKEDVCL